MPDDQQPQQKGLLAGFIGAVKQIASPQAPASPAQPEPPKETEQQLLEAKLVASKLLDEKIEQARNAADQFVGAKLDNLKAEAWLMVDMLEKRLDTKLDEFEKRLDERLQREIYWKLVGLRYTLLFALLVSLIGIGYTLIKRWLGG